MGVYDGWDHGGGCGCKHDACNDEGPSDDGRNHDYEDANDDYNRDVCDDDNDDEDDNPADDANFLALKNYKWSAPRRTSYVHNPKKLCCRATENRSRPLPGIHVFPSTWCELNSHAQFPRPGDPPSSHA